MQSITFVKNDVDKKDVIARIETHPAILGGF